MTTTETLVEIEQQVEEYALSYWRDRGVWPTIGQASVVLGMPLEGLRHTIRYSANMELWDSGEDPEIMVQCQEVDDAIGSYWTSWQDQQREINQT